MEVVCKQRTVNA
ncbi:hypothetical protein C5167_026291 [Papaver somniferum]|nr:hypothetical protein C5167_026291 [Papaver somniferum]